MFFLKDVSLETGNHYMESILGDGVFPQHGQQVATCVGNHHSEVSRHTVDGKKMHHPTCMKAWK